MTSDRLRLTLPPNIRKECEIAERQDDLDRAELCLVPVACRRSISETFESSLPESISFQEYLPIDNSQDV
jgi:hypothetical protein